MAYTPELSLTSSCTLRRIAWALGIPMTQAIERVFDHLPRILDGSKVCDACRDRTKCPQCVFCHSNHQSTERR
jgi:recombinational DNA repair protein RecR